MLLELTRLWRSPSLFFQGHQPTTQLSAHVSLEYSRQPRPLSFRPYTLEEFKQRAYDARGKYWTLGRLGPNTDAAGVQHKTELLTKRLDYAKVGNWD